MKTGENFRPKGAIFDIDGLMLDTEKIQIPLWTDAGKLLGYDIKKETVLDAVGKTGDDVRRLCIRDLGADFPYEDFKAALNTAASLEMGKGIAVKSGLSVLLDTILAANIPFAVATSNRRRWALWKLEKAGIADRFSVMVCGDEVAKKKPAPDVFLAAADKLGLSPSECAGFEDSISGLQSLNAAGMPSVFIKDMVEPPEDLLSTVWRRYNNLAEAAVLFL